MSTSFPQQLPAPPTIPVDCFLSNGSFYCFYFFQSNKLLPQQQLACHTHIFPLVDFSTTSKCHLQTMAAASFIVSFFHQPWLPFLEATEAFIASISSGATNHCFCNNWHAIMHIFPLVDCFLFFNLQTPPPDHGCHIIYSFLFSTNHGCLLALTMAAASFIVSFFPPTTAVHNTT